MQIFIIADFKYRPHLKRGRYLRLSQNGHTYKHSDHCLLAIDHQPVQSLHSIQTLSLLLSYNERPLLLRRLPRF